MYIIYIKEFTTRWAGSREHPIINIKHTQWGHLMHMENIFSTASLTNGMYDNPYQANAKSCKMQNSKARPKFFHQKAAQRVNTRQVIIMVVARALVLSHILFSCFTGPIKNIVLHSEHRFPIV